MKKAQLQGDFPGGPGVKTLLSIARGAGSVPGWGAKIPWSQKTKSVKQKQYSEDFKSSPYPKK